MADILARAEHAVREYIQRPEFIALLREAASGGGIEQRIADGLAQQIRRQEPVVRQCWHGVRLEYIALKPRPSAEKKAQALEELNRTGRVAEAADRTGLSRATLYRMLKR